MKFDIDGYIGTGDIEKKKVVEAKIAQFKKEANKEWNKTQFQKVSRIVLLCIYALGIITFFVCKYYDYWSVDDDDILLAFSYPLIVYIIIAAVKQYEFVKDYVNQKIIEEFEKKDDKNKQS